MEISAELRWFWQNAYPDSVEAWFRNGNFSAGGGASRDDVYLQDPAQTELGVKRRGAKPGVELKGLVAVLPPQDDRPGLGAPVEIWCKWSSLIIDLAAYRTISTTKLRWLRLFDTSAIAAREIELDKNERPKDGRPLPPQGCNLELAQVKIGNLDQVWWTLCFEAFGDLGTVGENLLKAIDKASLLGKPPVMGSAELLSYPMWLAKYATSV
jgi:hypothetical protein